MVVGLEIKSCFSARFHSPDCNGKPFESKAYFFLARKSDFRSSFLALEKKALLKKLGMESGIGF
ncbi:MAG: hypothetical protein ACOVLC_10710 [Flavobacterium sp.]